MTTTGPNLVDAAGNTIAFSKIRWTSSDGGVGPLTGSFSGGSQTLTSFSPNTWRESCLAFSYANDAIVAAGTYTGRVTYTLTVP